MKNFKIFYLVSFSFLMFSCGDYLDVNQQTNKPFYGQLKPSELLSAAQTDAYNFEVTSMNEYGNVQSNAWAGNVAAFGNVYPQIYQFTLNNNFQQALWNTQYLNVNNFARLSTVANPGNLYDNYIAAALICKVFYMQHIVDLYGDCPYSTAFLGDASGANTTPSYNDDQRVYRLMIADLEKAKLILNAANPNAESIASSDVMLGGVLADWYAFANTIELRMLVRMSNNTGAVAVWRDAKLAQLQTDLGGLSGFITAPVTINPGFSEKNDSTMNPYWEYMGLNAGATVASQNWTFIATSGHALKSLRTYASFAGGTNPSTVVSGAFNYPNVNDNRRLYLWRNATQRAVTQGSTSVDVFQTSIGQPCKGGQGLGLLDPYGAQASGANDFSNHAKAKGYVMTLQECLFLKAEAGLLGYPGFTAASAVADYNAGITESFLYLNVGGDQATAASQAAAYNSAAGIKNKIGYSMTATGATPGLNGTMKQGLMYQKWVALMGINGMESYIDYTRTGFPITPNPLGALPYSNRAKRLMYPNSELVSNSTNVPPVSEADCFSVNATSPFWLQGNPVLGN